MGKFDWAAAEKLGWTLVHEQEERLEQVSGDHYQKFPGLYRAEKRWDNGLVDQSGSSMERLLNAIESWERWTDRTDTAPVPATVGAGTVPATLPVETTEVVDVSVKRGKKDGATA